MVFNVNELKYENAGAKNEEQDIAIYLIVCVCY